MTDITPDAQLCCHCGLQRAAPDCGRAAVAAHWIAEEGGGQSDARAHAIRP